MVNKIAFVNGKGGCGKSTSIFHIAGIYGGRGEKTLVLSLIHISEPTRPY